MEINLDNKNIQDIKGHTKHKIALVTKYVENWLEVASNAEMTKSVCFIDGMCNAGIYSDGTLGTATEVLKLFVRFSRMFPNINYNLFCNDINLKRIDIIKKVFEIETDYKNCENLKNFISNKDVNEYILDLLKMEEYFGYNAHAFTLLFLDPYNFGTVRLSNVVLFLKSYYVELMYNFFVSDIKRNANNTMAADKQQLIIESMKGLKEYNGELDSDSIKQIIIHNFQQTKAKKCFTYKFKISTNVEIYNIIFASPKAAGITQLKKALWDVFDGDNNNYRLLKEELYQPDQITLFDDDFIKKDNLYLYSEEAIEKLKMQFAGKELNFTEIEEYLLCNTMLKSTQIIDNVLKPMIEKEFLIKRNCAGKSFKKDIYFFR